MVVTLIIINLAVYVVDIFLRDTAYSPSDWLSAYSNMWTDSLTKPWMWWQLLTYGFCHDPQHIGHIVGNMAGLLFLGQAVEQHYGARRFLRFYLTSLIVCSAFWCATNLILGHRGQLLGASGAVTTVIMLFALNFPRRTVLFMMFIPMPAWVLGVLIVLFNLFGQQSNDPNAPRVAYDVHLMGAAYAYLFFRTGWAFGLPGSKNPLAWLKAKRKSASRPKLKVFDAEDRYEVLDKQADQVLQKLHREGQESLTSKERRILEDYSRRMKQKHR